MPRFRWSRDDEITGSVANEQRLLSELSTKNRAELARLLATLAISFGDEADARGRHEPRRSVN